MHISLFFCIFAVQNSNLKQFTQTAGATAISLTDRMKYKAKCEKVKAVVESLLNDVTFETDGIFTYAEVDTEELAFAIEAYNAVAWIASKWLIDLRVAAANARALKANMSATYDLRFDDANDSSRKGWRTSYAYCQDYIDTYIGTEQSYFKDYKGGTVTIVCNETGEDINTFEIY